MQPEATIFPCLCRTSLERGFSFPGLASHATGCLVDASASPSSVLMVVRGSVFDKVFACYDTSLAVFWCWWMPRGTSMPAKPMLLSGRGGRIASNTTRHAADRDDHHPRQTCFAGINSGHQRPRGSMDNPPVAADGLRIAPQTERIRAERQDKVLSTSSLAVSRPLPLIQPATEQGMASCLGSESIAPGAPRSDGPGGCMWGVAWEFSTIDSECRFGLLS